MKKEPYPIPSDLRTKVHKALKLWHKADSQDNPLLHFQLYRNAMEEGDKTIRRAINEVLFQALSQLKENHEDKAHIIELRFLDGKEISDVAKELNFEQQTVSNKQSDGLKKLTEIVWEMECEARAEHSALLENRLELPTYHKLVGVQTAIDTLVGHLDGMEFPWIVAIEGIGGIGKTSLADALIRQMLDERQIQQLAWITARQSRLLLDGMIQRTPKPAIMPNMLIEALARQILDTPDVVGSMPTVELEERVHYQLKRTPHIVVIDNLESVTDLASLMDLIHKFINPTKFVLTSRLFHYADPDIYHFAIPELNQSDALYLIRQEAQLRNLPSVANAKDEELSPIFKAVGGNPLALRLMVGQMHLYSLKSILHNLQHGSGKATENLYTYIYEQLWEKLDEQTQLILIAMPLTAASGITAAELAQITEIDEPIVADELAKLVSFNLIDSHGGLFQQKRYTIHNLTRTFLNKKISKQGGSI